MLDDRPREWEMLALQGDFSQMPDPLLWRESGRLAHFLDGYREAGGFDELCDLAASKAAEARSTGVWCGSALELWQCLFFEHRAARHTGSDPGYGEELCAALRSALLALEPGEARRLATRLTSL
ncbi:hypothetical protein [Mesorhizobium marinum]|uniref:hypothetical protein n=1 Tax=Mesorhizobium marinum TaxID=3228790 RepID=UPI0034659F62